MITVFHTGTEIWSKNLGEGVEAIYLKVKTHIIQLQNTLYSSFKHFSQY